MIDGQQSGVQAEARERELLQSGFRYALSLTHHRFDAEDLVQEAWIKLQRKYGGVDGRPVLFRTVRNLFYDRYRRGKIIVFEPLDQPDAPGREAPAARTPAAAGGGDGTAPADLEVLLARLRSEEREILFLNGVEGYTAEEISNLLGRPRGTILSTLSRAKAKLSKFAREEVRR